MFLVAFLVLLSGFQHAQYAAKNYEKGNFYWERISRGLTFYAFPEGSQIAIADADTGTHNSYQPCTGYLARLLGNRNDIGGIVGPEHFFYDPFAQVDLWKNPMTGLKEEESLHLFRFLPSVDASISRAKQRSMESGNLERFSYFLRVITDRSEKSESRAEGDWDLCRLEPDGKISFLFSGHGLEEYLHLLKALEDEGISPEMICWGDPADEPGCNSPLRD